MHLKSKLLLMGAGVLVLLGGVGPPARADFSNVDPSYIPWTDFHSQFGTLSAPIKSSTFDFNPPTAGGDGQIISAVYTYSGSNAAYTGLHAYVYQVQVRSQSSTNDVENLIINWYSKFAQFGNGNLDSSTPGKNPLFTHAVDPSWLLTYSPNGDGNGFVYQISPTMPGQITGTTTNSFGSYPKVGAGPSWSTQGAGVGNSGLPSQFSLSNVEDTEEAGGIDLSRADADFLAHAPAQGDTGETGVLNAGQNSAILVFFSYSPWSYNPVDSLTANNGDLTLPPDGVTPSLYEPMPEPGAVALWLVGGFGLLGAGAYRRLRFRRALA
jgi:hypothetical protein